MCRLHILMLLVLLVVTGPERPRMSTYLQGIGQVRRQPDHLGQPSWTLSITWGTDTFLLYSGSERGALILEALLRGMYQETAE